MYHLRRYVIARLNHVWGPDIIVFIHLGIHFSFRVSWHWDVSGENGFEIAQLHWGDFTERSYHIEEWVEQVSGEW